MKRDVILEINGAEVPLNQFLKKVFAKVNIAIAETLKGFDEVEIKSLKLKVNLLDE